jgi:hypothetical protein
MGQKLIGYWSSTPENTCFGSGTYVVCLDCGREFSYDWLQMKVLPSKSQVDSAAALPAGIVPGLKAA